MTDAGIRSHLDSTINQKKAMKRSLFYPLSLMAVRPLAGIVALTTLAAGLGLRADETCSSPYLARIEGQEEFVYVWTLGVSGLGDGSDKLITIDVKPGSPAYGKVIHSSSVGG